MIKNDKNLRDIITNKIALVAVSDLAELLATEQNEWSVMFKMLPLEKCILHQIKFIYRKTKDNNINYPSISFNKY